jgi:hypothetical protein
MFQQLGDMRGMAYTLKGLGDLSLVLDSSERAIEQYLKAEKIFRYQGVKYGISNFSISRGKLENSKMWFLIFQYVAVWSL